MRISRHVRIGFAASIMPMLLHAQTTLVNGSFESPALSANQNFFASFAFDGWSGASTGGPGNAGLVLSPSWGLSALDGRQLFIFNGNNPAAGTYLEQAFSTTAGSHYRLTFGIGRNASAPEQVLGLRVDIFDQTGGLLLSSPASPPATAGFQTVTVSFVADSPLTRLRFTDVSGSNPNTDVALDAVSVTPTTPSLLVNGDFERPVLPSTQNFFGPFTFTGWSGESTGGSGNAGLVVGTNWGLAPADGRQIFIFNGNDPARGTYIEQTFSTRPGAAYDVEFAVGRNGWAPEQLLALQAEVFGVSGGLLSTLRVDAPGSGVFASHQFQFIADSESARLRFTDTSGVNPYTDIALDSVRVTAVPDTGSTAALACLALMAIAALRQKGHEEPHGTRLGSIAPRTKHRANGQRGTPITKSAGTERLPQSIDCT